MAAGLVSVLRRNTLWRRSRLVTTAASPGFSCSLWESGKVHQSSMMNKLCKLTRITHCGLNMSQAAPSRAPLQRELQSEPIFMLLQLSFSTCQVSKGSGVYKMATVQAAVPCNESVGSVTGGIADAVDIDKLTDCTIEPSFSGHVEIGPVPEPGEQKKAASLAACAFCVRMMVPGCDNGPSACMLLTLCSGLLSMHIYPQSAHNHTNLLSYTLRKPMARRTCTQ